MGARWCVGRGRGGVGWEGEGAQVGGGGWGVEGR